jgi:hypothetical protein
LAEGGKPHPANYLGFRHAKEEMQKKRQQTPWTIMGRFFFSNIITPGMSFAAALRGKREEHQQPEAHYVAAAGPCALTPA